jgi:hypothetical protein
MYEKDGALSIHLEPEKELNLGAGAWRVWDQYCLYAFIGLNLQGL